MLGKYLDNVREKSPLVHNITNYVTVTDVANVILACGGSPIMSDEVAEAEDITALCDGLNINIGTLNENSIKAMFVSGKRANELDKITVLDPVGVGASSLRTNTANELINKVRFDVIKGNASEFKVLSKGSSSTKGVDVSADDAITEENSEHSLKLIREFAKRVKGIVVVTGKTDIVCDGEACAIIKNGCSEMEGVTGMGCVLSGLLTAFLCANRDNRFSAAVAAVCAMGLAGETACKRMEKGEGNASFRARIIDAIYNMTGSDLDKGAKYDIK